MGTAPGLVFAAQQLLPVLNGFKGLTSFSMAFPIRVATFHSSLGTFDGLSGSLTLFTSRFALSAVDLAQLICTLRASFYLPLHVKLYLPPASKRAVTPARGNRLAQGNHSGRR